MTLLVTAISPAGPAPGRHSQLQHHPPAV